MSNRRSFLKNSGLTLVSTSILADPFIQTLKTFSGESADCWIRKITGSCEIIRKEDFLVFKYYFFNLTHNTLLGRLVKTDGSKNAYILVRLRQQHIGEELKQYQQDKSCLAEIVGSEFSQTLVSGFSFLTFALKTPHIDYTAESLLDWSQFSLVTPDWPGNTLGALPAEITSPVAESKIPAALQADTKVSNDVPVSLLELPYKLFLSPVVPDAATGMTQPAYYFQRNNRARLYWAPPYERRSLHELWSNDLGFTALSNRGWQKLLPEFRILAYDDTPDYMPDKTVMNLLPASGDRKDLAMLTNLVQPGRHANADYFNISSLGASTYLHYKNNDPQGWTYVEWKQEVKLGRDNYVELIQRGIDLRTGLKVLLSTIAERRIENGKSFLLKRNYFRYLDPFKDYSGLSAKLANNCPFKTITPLETGSYFAFHYITSDSTTFIPIKECGEKGFPDETLKMRYTVTDADNNSYQILLDLCIVSETNFASAGNGIAALNKVIAAGDIMPIDIKGASFSYAAAQATPPVPTSSAQTLNNTRYATSELQLYPILNSGTFTDPYPILPKLKYAKAIIPHLNGIENVPQARTLSYAPLYINETFSDNNKGGVFLALLQDSIKSYAIQNTTEDVSLTAPPAHGAPNAQVDPTIVSGVLSEIVGLKTQLGGVFSKAYKNIGSLINPDIVIENVSVTPQAITHTQGTSYSLRGGNRSIKPADILRGAQVQLFGGIDLLQILAAMLDIDDSPVFQVIDQAMSLEQTLSQNAGSILSNLKSQYDSVKADVARLPGLIQGYEDQLKQLLNDPVKTYKDDFISKLGQQEQTVLKQVDFSSLTAAGVTETQPVCDWVNTAEKEYATTFYDFVNANLNAYAADLRGYIQSVDTYFTNAIAQVTTLVSGKQLVDAVNAHIADIQTDLAGGGANFTEGDLQQAMAVMGKVQAFVASANAPNTLASLAAGFPTMPVSKDHKPYLEVYIRRWLYQVAAGMSTTLDNTLLTTEIDAAHTKVQTILQNAKIITDKGVFDLTTDLGAWLDFLNGQKTTLTQAGTDAYKLILQLSNRIHQNSSTVVATLQKTLNDAIAKLQSQVSDAIKQFDAANGLVKQIMGTNAYSTLKKTYFFWQQNYRHLNNVAGTAQKLAKNAPVPASKAVNDYLAGYAKALQDYQGKMTGVWTQAVTTAAQAIQNPSTDETKAINALVTGLGAAAAQWGDEVGFSDNFDAVQDFVADRLDALNNLVDAAKQKLQQELSDSQTLLRDQQQNLGSFAATALAQLNDKLNDAYTALGQAAAQGIEAEQQAQALVDELQSDINALKALTTQTLSYTWHTEAFTDVNLGLLSFITNDSPATALDVSLQTVLHFDPTAPQVIKSTDSSVSTSVTNFSICFLDILTIDFDDVSYINGQGGEHFGVQIRDVHFSGPLDFVQVFQSLLQTLDKGLTLDIDSSGATLGYTFDFPDISGGAFNFLNAKLVMSLHLPFKAGVPMLFTFGFCTPQDLFLVSYLIFGGRGCLVLGVEPKRGIVSVQLVIEMGVTLDIDLGPASGDVYMFAGIYINKQYNSVTIDGYLTAGGNLNILDLVTLSVTFYMGLQGSGNYMEGYCSVSVTIDIGPFISISVSLSMYKRIYGSPDNSQTGNANAAQHVAHGPAADLLENGITMVQPNGDIKANKIDPEGQRAMWEDYFNSYYHSL